MANDECYTPTHIIEAVRYVLGDIELDPASCEEANKTVRAERYFTREDDGLAQDWGAHRVWLNPPYSRPLPWVEKMVSHAGSGIMLLNATTDTRAGQMFLEYANHTCFLRGRLQFTGPKLQTSNGNPRGQMVGLFGSTYGMACRFVEWFTPLGVVFNDDC